MIRTTISYLIIFLVFAAYTGSSFGLHLELQSVQSKAVHAGQGEDADSAESRILVISPFNAIHQPGHLVFQSTFCFEFDLPSDAGDDPPEPMAVPQQHTYYRTLFGRIIKPNAP